MRPFLLICVVYAGYATTKQATHKRVCVQVSMHHTRAPRTESNDRHRTQHATGHQSSCVQSDRNYLKHTSTVDVHCIQDKGMTCCIQQCHLCRLFIKRFFTHQDENNPTQAEHASKPQEVPMNEHENDTKNLIAFHGQLMTAKTRQSQLDSSH